jgi:peptidyl-prolyl cis-trans isomerase A (cyclophilin A)
MTGLRSLTGVAAAAALVAGLDAATPRAQQTGAPAPRDLTKPELFRDKAPDTFNAVFDTTAGIFVVRVTRDWAPHGADRFYNLVKHGFFDQCRFFRVVKDFAVQFGLHGHPKVAAAWDTATIPADRPRVSNTRRRVTFAMTQLATSRTTQVFINLGNNSRLDIDGFAPIGEVISSLLIVERIFHEYGEGPDQAYILGGGNDFLTKYFPKMDYVKSATIETGHRANLADLADLEDSRGPL